MSKSTGRIGNATTPVQDSARPAFLAVNGGSSSLKFALYDLESACAGLCRRMGRGRIERIGQPDASMSAQLTGDQEARERSVTAPDLGAAAGLLIDWLERTLGRQQIAAVGFRVVHGGCPIDTTMGLTPASGLVMSTRCGDIDPGLFLYLTRMVAGMSAEVFHRMVNHESGLLGVSETSSDIRELLACRADDERAAEAVELFCYQAKKGIGALAAALGGLDLLVFSGGIGENSPDIRAETCAGLEFLGINIDPIRNRGNEPVITTETSRTPIRVIQTDEESMIARYTARFVPLKE